MFARAAANVGFRYSSQTPRLPASAWHIIAMLGLLAAGAFTEINVKDVVAPVAAVCGATIAAITAWWNAHKTPSNRLQAFVAIHQSWPDPLPGKAHIAELIAVNFAKCVTYTHISILATPPLIQSALRP